MCSYRCLPWLFSANNHNRIGKIVDERTKVSYAERLKSPRRSRDKFKMFTVHSLRHSHLMKYVVDRKVTLPIVQKQVGHRSLKTTSVYLSPSTEKMAQAYGAVREKEIFGY